ncbi:Battenin [Liparis tanakae]|uniref:Battenin n=1 Tax=Liparis tanakae TaxID=230148 RepID=A0A4Z2HID7_9TELE|nr:Battenin [Liparis tanakae]
MRSSSSCSPGTSVSPVPVPWLVNMERSSINAARRPEARGGEEVLGSGSLWRNWSGFWLLGLCNNFAYVVMLSAAHDILKTQQSQNASASTSATIAVEFQDGNSSSNSSNSSRYDCNPVSTAAVLLADILPTLAIKLSAPFVIHKLPYGFRVLFCSATAATSFLLVAFSSAVWMSILGNAAAAS